MIQIINTHHNFNINNSQFISNNNNNNNNNKYIPITQS